MAVLVDAAGLLPLAKGGGAMVVGHAGGTVLDAVSSTAAEAVGVGGTTTGGTSAGLFVLSAPSLDAQGRPTCGSCLTFNSGRPDWIRFIVVEMASGAVLTEAASLTCCLGFRPGGAAEVLETVLGTGLVGALLGALAVVPFRGPLACCFLLDAFWLALR